MTRRGWTDGAGVVSIDSADSIAQVWHDCLHNNPEWLPENAPVSDRRWRLGIYVMENDPH